MSGSRTVRRFGAWLALALVLICIATPATATPLLVAKLAAGTTDSALIAGSTGDRALLFCGLSVRETGATDESSLEIYAGTDATGRHLFTLSLAPGESRSEGPWDVPSCLAAPEGIYVDRTGPGTTLVLIFYQRHKQQ